MKRTVTLLLVLCLLLCACGSKAEVPETSNTETTAATTEATTEATVSDGVCRHPLTGQVLDAPYTGRPTAVVINNLKAAMPQSGISQADMLYEFETEGGITRMLAIFSDLTNVGSIGPIRSDRTYFNNIVSSYDIPVVHCGGGSRALKGQYDRGHTLEKWDHIDQVSYGSYFYRDTQRRQQGYAYEHTLFTTGEKLINALEKLNFNTITEEGVDYGLNFSEDVSVSGETANQITVKFHGKKETSFTYDADNGLYLASQYGNKHMDAAANKQMAYKNVLVIQAKQDRIKDGKYTRSYYDMIGEGKGYFACNGQMIPMQWSRKTVTDPFVYTMEDGTPLTLGVGTSYIAVVDTEAPAGVTCK